MSLKDKAKVKLNKILKFREQTLNTFKTASGKRLDLLIEALKTARAYHFDGQNFLDTLQGQINDMAVKGVDTVKEASVDNWPEDKSSIFDSVIAEASRIGILLCLEHIIRNNVFNSDNVDKFIYQINNVMPYCEQNIASMVELFDQMRQGDNAEESLKMLYERVQDIQDEGIKNEDLIQTTLGVAADYGFSVCMISLLERDNELYNNARLALG